uniref:SDR family oxidoreductase n=1 Tax=Thaumasiovibrio occultus TaxID=1891184 RepID=UPI000B357399|nr:SDR family NAD(P)-dependent oxidoreductase [Thaumasiovibrio occultus]
MAKAIITGGTGGIGEMVTELLRQREYEVIDLSFPDVDVTNPQSVAEALSEHQDAEVVICCAGVQVSKPIHKMDTEDFDRVVKVNLNGTFNVIHYMLPHLRDRGFGRIVTISSVMGRKGEFGLSGYCASKWGVRGLTEVVAKEGAAKGISCVSIAPTFVDTPLIRDLRDDIVENIIESIPARRLLQPKEVADVIMWAIDHGMDVNGKTIPVDLGQVVV